MQTIKILQINAKELKKQLIEFGVSVKRCRQNGRGALITIDRSDDNKEDFYRFCFAVGLTRLSGSMTIHPIGFGDNYYDFGTLYQVEKD